jgi:hypothetical protein
VAGRRKKPTPPKQPPELQALADAVNGLTYPSKSDAPFDVFSEAQAASAEEAVAKRRGGAKPETVSLDQFFSELADTHDAERFRQLRQVIEQSLSGAKVLRVGSQKVDIYVAGRTAAGGWAGPHTTSVET